MFTDVLHGYVTIVEAINSKTHLTAPAMCVFYYTICNFPFTVLFCKYTKICLHLQTGATSVEGR